ncbi:MAG TPA: hypothetical protein VH186_04720 [Chloroflexia bacterium]|nr:hypothetical protein [Chloroflexia bacterium]
MADTGREKLSTCPICGYTDTATDPEALRLAIEEHIRMAHNLDPATLMSGTSVKPTNERSNVANEPPAAAPVANIGSSASGEMAPPNIGPENEHYASGAPNPVAHDPMDPDVGRA